MCTIPGFWRSVGSFSRDPLEVSTETVGAFSLGLLLHVPSRLVDVYCAVKSTGENPGILIFQIFYDAWEKHIFWLETKYIPGTLYLIFNIFDQNTTFCLYFTFLEGSHCSPNVRYKCGNRYFSK